MFKAQHGEAEVANVVKDVKAHCNKCMIYAVNISYKESHLGQRECLIHHLTHTQVIKLVVVKIDDE